MSPLSLYFSHTCISTYLMKISSFQGLAINRNVKMTMKREGGGGGGGGGGGAPWNAMLLTPD